MKNNMINIGLIGTQSMHAWAFAQACNIPDSEGNYHFPDARVTAVYGVDDTEEHTKLTMEKGYIPIAVSSLEELYEHCNAFMILQRRGSEHLEYATELIKKSYPVFIDKPVCCTLEDMKRLQALAAAQAFGPIKGATINHSADMDSPYGSILYSVMVFCRYFGAFMQIQIEYTFLMSS